METNPMDAFVTALTTALTPTALWGTLTGLAGIITVVVVFALGVHFLRRVIGGVSRGKAKI